MKKRLSLGSIPEEEYKHDSNHDSLANLTELVEDEDSVSHISYLREGQQENEEPWMMQGHHLSEDESLPNSRNDRVPKIPYSPNMVEKDKERTNFASIAK